MTGVAHLASLLPTDTARDEATEVPIIVEPTEPPREVTALVTEEAVEEKESGNSRNSRRLPARATDPQNDEEIEEEIESENESETGRGGQGVDLTDFEDLGLVSETEYVIPQYDVEIVWDENWYFDGSTTDPIVSDTEAEGDSISITWAGESYVVAYVDIMSSGGFVPEDYVDYWTSEEYRSTSTAPDSEILLDDVTDSSGAVLYRDYLEDGTEISVLSEMACLDRRCDLVSITMMIGLPTSFGDAYADVEGGIQVDGDPLFVTFSPRQIDRAID